MSHALIISLVIIVIIVIYIPCFPVISSLTVISHLRWQKKVHLDGKKLRYLFVFMNPGFNHSYLNTSEFFFFIITVRNGVKLDADTHQHVVNSFLRFRCTRKKECSRGEEKDAWLWSPNQKCVAIKSFDPSSLSCKKTKQV